MNKQLFFAAISIFISSFASFCKAPEPTFASPVYLFKETQFGDRIAEVDPNTPQEVQKYLNTPEGHTAAQKMHRHPNAKETGYDEQRIENGTGQLIQPDTIILTFSGKQTLAETVDSLERNRLAHNFIIDLDGSIHPAIKKGGTIRESLTHRPFAVGISCQITDDGQPNRDMNARSVTISLVGSGNQHATPEQIKSLLQLVAWLEDELNITPDNVQDFGLIAYPIGRRNVNPNLPWRQLHQAGLAVYPDVDRSMKFQPIQQRMSQEQFNAHWAFGVLSQLGYATASTNDPDNENLKKYVAQFQKWMNCDRQDGTLTPHTLAVLNECLKQKEEIKPERKRWPHSE